MAEAYVGEIRIFSYGKVPVGWLACQGQLLSIQEYMVLYAVIGTIYGGDGQTTFQLPDLRGRAPIHFCPGAPPAGITAKPLGNSGGAEVVAVQAGQLPAHSHPLYAVLGATAATGVIPTNAMLAQVAGTNTFYFDKTQGGTPTDITMSAQAISSTGGNGAHPNMMTSFVLNYMICTQGIYPEQQ
jgi:microcystin-dependent protein